MKDEVEIVIRGSYALRSEIIALLDELGLNVVADRGLTLTPDEHDRELNTLEDEQTPIKVIVRDTE